VTVTLTWTTGSKPASERSRPWSANTASSTMFTKTSRKEWSSAVTLVELLVAISITTIVALAVIEFTIYTSRSFAGIMNYIELESQSRTALDKMVKEIRQVNCLTDYTNTSSLKRISFEDYDTGCSPIPGRQTAPMGP